MVNRDRDSRPETVYVDARTRFIDLVRSLPADDLDMEVPACPGWTALDIVRHLIGSSEDFLAANWPGATVTFTEWTAAQVARNAGKSLEQLLAQWDGTAPQLAEGIAGGTLPALPLINDIATHEQDIRGAIGLPGGREADGYAMAWNRWTETLNTKINEAALPALSMRTEAGERILGSGQSAVSVSAPAFELCRAFSGRRSLAQIEAMEWQGDPAPYVALLPVFGVLPTRDIVEAA
jgi:uncharacterized protein (TIGR03083 family)